MKVPLFIEVIGENATGKTHFIVAECPDPFLIDLSPKGEGKAIILKYYPDEIEKRYIHIRTVLGAYNSLQSIRNAVKGAVEAGRKTIGFDPTPYLRVAAEEEVKMEHGKVNGASGIKEPLKMVYPITLFGDVYTKVDSIIGSIIDSGVNVVFTAQLKDEYIRDVRTGVRIRDGHRRADFIADYRILLILEEENDEMVRKAKVVKNRFVDRVNENEWTDYLADISFNGIVNTIPEKYIPKEYFVL